MENFCLHKIDFCLLPQYVPLMAESILLFANDNVWTQDLNRKTKYWVHGVLITVGTVALTAGTVLEIDIKGNRAHFTSNHGLTGNSTKNRNFKGSGNVLYPKISWIWFASRKFLNVNFMAK